MNKNIDWLKGIVTGIYATLGVLAIIIFCIIFYLLIKGLLEGRF